MEEETLEEFIEREGYPDGTTQEIWEDGVRIGVDWQSKKMYSEEEKELMIKIFHSYWFENNPEHEDNLKEWELSKKLFDQFKNKDGKRRNKK